MSINPVSSFKGGLAASQTHDGTPSTPAPFVRGPQISTTGRANAADKAGALRHGGGPVSKLKTRILEGCRTQGLGPGEQKTLMVQVSGGNGAPATQRPMILRRTAADDGFMFQTPEQAVLQPTHGLCLKDDLSMSYDAEPLPFVSTNQVANGALLDLARTLSVSTNFDMRPMPLARTR